MSFKKQVFVVFHSVRLCVFFSSLENERIISLEHKLCSVFSEQPAKEDFIKEENL